jgi:hypothetical protein
MPFDLPETALAAGSVGAWCKAANYRDFQDKFLRIIQVRKPPPSWPRSWANFKLL